MRVIGGEFILDHMVKINHHYQKLSNTYLFEDIQKRVAAFKAKNAKVALIDLGIGDFTKPLYPSVVSSLTTAAQEMGDKKTFRGYGPTEGYLFLREAIAKGDYKGLGITADEIFISDGANSDLADLQEIFSIDNRVAIPLPSYPVYLETNIMAGRTRPLLKTGKYGGVTYLPCTEENGFNPEPPHAHTDLIYLCSPNNPTGVAMGKDLLKRWVDYAKREGAIILFDGAYEAYVTSDAPRSIYEIEGAKEVAIEIRSFSKSAGFTGLRCSYTVIPHQLQVRDAGALHKIHSLWRRRVDAKTNGVSYPIQKAAAALYSSQGQAEMKATIKEISERGKYMVGGMKRLGYTVYGGVDSPYLWCKTPPKVSSWEFFDFLLENAQIISIPGEGFGVDGYFRLSAFAEQPALADGLNRLKNLL